MSQGSIVEQLVAHPEDAHAVRAAARALRSDPAGFLAAMRDHYQGQAPAAGSDPLARFAARKPTWVNYGGNQPVYAAQLENPTSLAELREIVRRVTDRGGRLRAVGSGHSFSDILQTDDVLINMKSLLGPNEPSCVLRLEDELWKDPIPEAPRVRVICGGTIRQLNPALASAGLGFANLGGYDAQTLIGAISTSTHGSGLGLPPFPDAVRSLVLVTTGGKVYQIEPEDGITDPAKFARRYAKAEIELKQDDDWFYAAIVSMGCMGVIYSLTLDVIGGYMLREDVSYEPWLDVKKRVANRAYIERFRHLEVHLNPHPLASGELFCNVVYRDLADPGAAPRPLPRSRRVLTKLAFTPELQKLLVRTLNDHPALTPDVLDTGLRGQVTERESHIEQSYRIYNLGPVNNAAVTAIEFAFPLDGGVFLAAIDRLLAVIAQNRVHGLYQNGPLALRFVKQSRAYLSMMYGRDTCTCEIAMLNGTLGGDEMLLSYEKALYEFGTRLHWGQRQELTGAPGWLEAAYPMAGRWLEVYRELNRRGVFNNHFTDRMGISVHPEPDAERT